MKMNDIISMLTPEKSNKFLNTFIESVLFGGPKTYEVDENVLMSGGNQTKMIVPPDWTPGPKPVIKEFQDLDRTLFGSSACAECRRAQAKSNVMNISDPCQGVCG